MAVKKTTKSVKKVTSKKPSSDEVHPFAIVSLVAGIFGLLFSWVFIGFPILVAAIVFGFLALHRIKETPQKGHGMALAGLITGFTGLLIFLILSLIFFFSMAMLFVGIAGEVLEDIATMDVDVAGDDVSMTVDFTDPQAQDIVIRDGELISPTPS